MKNKHYINANNQFLRIAKVENSNIIAAGGG